MELTVFPLKEMVAVHLRETETVILIRTNGTSLKGASTVGVRGHTILREDSTGPLRGVVAVPQRELTVFTLKEMDAVPLRETETVILSRNNRTSLKGTSTVGVRGHNPIEKTAEAL